MFPLSLLSLACGVGHNLRPTTVSKFGNRFSAHADSGVIVAAIALQLLGVGHNPDSVSLVWRTNGCCRYDTPSRIKPHRGQVPENSIESSRSEHWGVFHIDISGFHFANDSRHVTPHSRSGSFDASASSSGRNVLTGKSSRYDINTSCPRFSVKGLNVIPNRERRENSVILSREQYACCVGFPLNGTDSAPSKQVSPEYSSTSACEKSQLIHVTSYINKIKKNKLT
jgi:hypothetical protein